MVAELRVAGKVLHLFLQVNPNANEHITAGRGGKISRYSPRALAE